MNKRSGPDLVVAKASFWVTTTGRSRYIRAGDAWMADDPLVRANKRQFEPLRVHSSLSETPVDEPSSAGVSIDMAVTT